MISSLWLVPPSEEYPMGVSLSRKHGQKFSWGLYYENYCFSKDAKNFCFEVSPSSRDEEFFLEFRFNNLREALLLFEEYLSNDTLRVKHQRKVYFNNKDHILKIIDFIEENEK